jgi:hypothetical protein
MKPLVCKNPRKIKLKTTKQHVPRSLSVYAPYMTFSSGRSKVHSPCEYSFSPKQHTKYILKNSERESKKGEFHISNAENMYLGVGCSVCFAVIHAKHVGNGDAQNLRSAIIYSRAVRQPS